MSTPDGEGRLRVVAADNSKPMLDKVVLMLQADFEVVATAADGRAALEMIQLLQPDIAVLDISMPNMTGIEVAEELKNNYSDVKVLILTVHDDSDYVRAARRRSVGLHPKITYGSRSEKRDFGGQRRKELYFSELCDDEPTLWV
jgi:CheY-like chemotaxis protein